VCRNTLLKLCDNGRKFDIGFDFFIAGRHCVDDDHSVFAWGIAVPISLDSADCISDHRDGKKRFLKKLDARN
jgi:hypothetical protein